MGWWNMRRWSSPLLFNLIQRSLSIFMHSLPHFRGKKLYSCVFGFLKPVWMNLVRLLSAFIIQIIHIIFPHSPILWWNLWLAITCTSIISKTLSNLSSNYSTWTVSFSHLSNVWILMKHIISTGTWNDRLRKLKMLFYLLWQPKTLNV